MHDRYEVVEKEHRRRAEDLVVANQEMAETLVSLRAQREEDINLRQTQATKVDDLKNELRTIQEAYERLHQSHRITIQQVPDHVLRLIMWSSSK